MLTMKEVLHLTNRQTEGFMRSLFALLKIPLPVPDHSTLSKRGKNLKVNLPKKTSHSLKIVMDSTGLKIYGEGEWKVDNPFTSMDAKTGRRNLAITFVPWLRQLCSV